MKKFLALTLTLASLLFAPMTLAATTPIPSNTPCPTSTTSAGDSNCSVEINIVQPKGSGIRSDIPLGTVIGNLITIVFSISALIVLIMIIWGGLEWIFSAGDKEKIGKARDRILHAIIGLALIALAFLIARVVGNLVNIDLINLKIPALGQAP